MDNVLWTVILLLNICYSNSLDKIRSYNSCANNNDPNKRCVISQIYLNETDFPHNFLQACVEEDDNTNVRQIVIYIPQTHLKGLGIEIDRFVTPRPWWLIREEPFHWKHHQYHKSRLNTTLSRAVLIRHGFKWEQHLRWLSNVQYPPTETACATSRLIAGHMVDSGYASFLLFYTSVNENNKYAIFSVYSSKTNSPQESTPFVSGEMCPTEINKWLCAFLPPTNCTYPDALVKCQEPVQVHGHRKCLNEDFLYYNSTSAGGVRVDKSVFSDASQPKSIYHNSLQDKYVTRVNAPFIPGPFYDASNKSVHYGVSSSSSMFQNGFLFRPNHIFRDLISRRLSTLQKYNVANQSYGKINSFTNHSSAVDELSEGQCVAIHIRRGDRCIESLNATENRKFCQKCLAYRDKKSLAFQGPEDMREKCLGMGDLGCFGENPFGALTLNDYLNRSWGLKQTRNVFLMTDATTEWLEQEMATIDRRWNIYALPAVTNDGMHRKSHGMSTQNGVDFLASIAMASRCDGFVGHFLSGVALILFSHMCFHHKKLFGTCPPTVNIGQNL